MTNCRQVLKYKRGAICYAGVVSWRKESGRQGYHINSLFRSWLSTEYPFGDSVGWGSRPFSILSYDVDVRLLSLRAKYFDFALLEASSLASHKRDTESRLAPACALLSAVSIGCMYMEVLTCSVHVRSTYPILHPVLALPPYTHIRGQNKPRL